MESPPKLPPDVLGYIADTLAARWLYEKDRDIVKALKMLSLTCRFMVPVCRRYLFANVKLPFSHWDLEREINESRNQFGYGDRNLYQSLYEISVELRQLGGRTVLEVLEVKGMVEEDTLPIVGSKDWAVDFDQMLTDVGSFSALRRVTVDLRSYYNDQHFQKKGPGICVLTDAWFPKLSESTVIDFILCAVKPAGLLP